MRTAKLKLTAVVLAATGLVALAGLGTALALAPKPAPLAQEPDQPPAATANAEDDPPQPDNKPKIDRKWQERPFPSAFPEIEPLGIKSLDEFEKKHVEPIYESDPPLRKLQKARLQVVLNRLRNSVERAEKFEPQPLDRLKPGTRPPFDIWPDLERLSKESQQATALAFEVDPTREGRRTWLAFRVATEKLVELTGQKGPYRRADDDVPRLDAEIELAKFDKQTQK